MSMAVRKCTYLVPSRSETSSCSLGWGHPSTIWVEGGVYARLDDPRAGKRLTDARTALFESGPVRHALAAALDEGMFLARHLDERSLKSLRTLISKCLRELDLDKELRRRVQKVEEVLNEKPEKAFQVLDALRRHFVVSVPGLL